MVGINRSVGRSLKRLRENKQMSMDDVIDELRRRFRISFSQSSFSRMELEQSEAKALVVAALCLIYDVRLENVLLTNYQDGYYSMEDDYS